MHSADCNRNKRALQGRFVRGKWGRGEGEVGIQWEKHEGPEDRKWWEEKQEPGEVWVAVVESGVERSGGDGDGWMEGPGGKGAETET